LSNGAGVYSGVGPALIKNCLFRLNYSKAGCGAGLFATSGKTTVNASVFDGNIAAGTSSNSGGIYLKHTTLTMVNSVLTGNSCVNDGGAMYCDSASAAITNCTFYANSASTLGGGVTSIGSTVAIINTILWHDKGGSVSCNGNPGCFVDLKGTGFSVSYSCVTGGYTGTGNISGDPQFFSPTNPPGANGHYGNTQDGLSLGQNSPCINAGQTISLSIDILGIQRPTGTGYEIGAYEYVQESGSFGKLVRGNFVPISVLPIQSKPLTIWDINYALASNNGVVYQLQLPNDSHIRNTGSFTATVQAMTNSGTAVGGTHNIKFYQVNSGGLLFRSYNETISKSVGKRIVFVTEDTPDAIIGEHPKAYVIKFPATGGYFNYSVDNSQFK